MLKASRDQIKASATDVETSEVATCNWCRDLKTAHKQKSEVATCNWCRDLKIAHKQKSEVMTCNWCRDLKTPHKQTSEVATRKRGRDINQDRDTPMKSRHQQPNGPANLKSTRRRIKVRAQLKNLINK